jgi:hypothetical protein
VTHLVKQLQYSEESYQNGAVKIVYVASETPSGGGVEIHGRSLARHLSTEHELRVCGGILRPGSLWLEAPVPDWAMSTDELDEFDVVYMEGGWNSDSLARLADQLTQKNDPRARLTDRFTRFSLELAEAFVRRGGQLIVADVGRKCVSDQRQSLEEARGLFRAYVEFGEVGGKTGVRCLYDEDAQDGYTTCFFPSQMVLVDDWLKPALEGIDSILAFGAVDLGTAHPAACGNEDTAIRVEGAPMKKGPIPPAWASVNVYGRGHAVLIAAEVSADRLVDRSPDNARWISNLMALLTDRSRETEGWLVRKSARTEPNAGVRSLLDQPESQRLERKSSFLVSTDPKHPEIPQYVIQHNVGKSVAALANTDGGHVIIGQADDLTIGGLVDDFAQVTKNSGRDGFELKLVEYINNTLHPGWAALGLQVHWLDHDGLDIGVVEVPRSEAIVYLTDRKNKDEEAVYIRSGTRSDKLAGRELADWIRQGRRR